MIRLGGVLGKSEGDSESALETSGGDGDGDAVLSGECECELSTGRLADCMLLSLGMEKSFGTQHMLRSTMGVPKDCWLWQVASLEADEVGGQAVQCRQLVWFWLEPPWDSQARLLFFKKVERCLGI